MRLPSLVPGRFVRRDNRFRVTVQVAGEPVAAHLANSGRLSELLTRGRSCWLAERNGPRRKTRFDLTLVDYADTLVSVDARLPNPLVAEALAAGRMEPFQGYDSFEREVRSGESRLDFRLSGAEGVCWIEAKSVTLVEDDLARFPDAPTTRGARHVEELATAVSMGERAAIVFVIQRSDALCFAPHDQADPIFGAALREAARAGVGVYAWTCEVSLRHIVLASQVPLKLTVT